MLSFLIGAVCGATVGLVFAAAVAAGTIAELREQDFRRRGGRRLARSGPGHWVARR